MNSDLRNAHRDGDRMSLGSQAMWRWIPIFCGAAVLAVIAGIYASDAIKSWRARQVTSTQNDTTRKTNTSPGPLFIPVHELELGKIPEATEHKHRFPISNTGTNTIVIRHFENSCNCLSIAPNQDVELQPGDVKDFELTIRALPEQTEKLANEEERRLLLFTAIYITQGQQQRTEWAITYQITPTIRVEPLRDSFGKHSITAGSLVRRASIQLAKNTKTVEVSPHPEWEIRLIPASGEANPSSVLQLVAIARHPKTSRIIDDTITLTPINRDGLRLPAKTFRLEGALSPDVVVAFETLHYGHVVIGNKVTDTVRFLSLTDMKFKVVEAQELPSGWQVTRSDYDEHVWTVTALASQLGEQKQAIRFLIRDQDGHDTLLSLPVVYLGRQPK